MTMTPDSIQWLLDHTAATYENEAKATDKLKERISFIFSIAITPSVGLAFYLASGLKAEMFSIFNIWLFWLPWFIAVLYLIVAVVLTCEVLLRGWYYHRVPLPSEIISFFDKHPEPDKALEEAKLAFLSEYSIAVDHNTKQNEKRAHKLLQAQRIAFCAMMLLFVSLGRWVYCAGNAQPEPQAVKIVAPIEIKRDDMPISSTPKTASTTQQQNQDKTQQQPASLPITNNQKPRPSFPKGKLIMESLDITPKIPSK